MAPTISLAVVYLLVTLNAAWGQQGEYSIAEIFGTSYMIAWWLYLISKFPVYLSLGSTTITVNNTEIIMDSIGEDFNRLYGFGQHIVGAPSLICHTDLTACCRGIDTGGQGPLGEWHYPDGRVVPNQAAGEDFYRVRNAPQLIRLARRDTVRIPTVKPTGSYCCVIPTTGGKMTFCASVGKCVTVMTRSVHHHHYLWFYSCMSIPASSDQWNHLLLWPNTGFG